jgi:hypothetical protein
MKAENPLFVSSPFLAAPSLPAKVGALVLPLLFALAACGGGAASAPPPETPTAAAEPAAVTNTASGEAPAAAPDSQEAKAKSGGATSTASSPSTSAPAAAAPAKIEFPPHATVEQAIKAIPQGQPRMNMADEALRAPLLDLKRYDKCKVPRSTHVTMSVAVYDGAAVGADISSKPKNAKIEECVDEVVRSMTWSKVPSLNTVTASF